MDTVHNRGIKSFWLSAIIRASVVKCIFNLNGVADMRGINQILFISLLTTFLFMSGCDSGGSSSGFPIEGTWEQKTDETPLYAEITSDAYKQYETYEGDCYYLDAADIVNKDGNMYTLSERNGNDTTTVRMVVDGGELTIQQNSKVLVFEETNADPSNFERCN